MIPAKENVVNNLSRFVLIIWILGPHSDSKSYYKPNLDINSTEIVAYIY